MDRERSAKRMYPDLNPIFDFLNQDGTFKWFTEKYAKPTDAQLKPHWDAIVAEDAAATQRMTNLKASRDRLAVTTSGAPTRTEIDDLKALIVYLFDTTPPKR